MLIPRFFLFLRGEWRGALSPTLGHKHCNEIEIHRRSHIAIIKEIALCFHIILGHCCFTTLPPADFRPDLILACKLRGEMAFWTKFGGVKLIHREDEEELR